MTYDDWWEAQGIQDPVYSLGRRAWEAQEKRIQSYQEENQKLKEENENLKQLLERIHELESLSSQRMLQRKILQCTPVPEDI